MNPGSDFVFNFNIIRDNFLPKSKILWIDIGRKVQSVTIPIEK